MVRTRSQRVGKSPIVVVKRLGSRKKSPPPKRRMIVFPTAITEIPPDVASMTFGEDLKLPEGYINATGTKDSRKNAGRLATDPEKRDSALKDSIITPEFERNFVDGSEKSYRTKVKERKKANSSTGGKDWYNIKSPELTEDVERDLKILQMRSILDPKRFYKHNDRQAIPKHFQIGRIMDNAADFYSSRVPKKQRKRNLAEELLEDAEFQQYQKRKYNELAIQKKKQFVKKKGGKRKKKFQNVSKEAE